MKKSTYIIILIVCSLITIVLLYLSLSEKYSGVLADFIFKILFYIPIHAAALLYTLSNGVLEFEATAVTILAIEAIVIIVLPISLLQRNMSEKERANFLKYYLMLEFLKRKK